VLNSNHLMERRSSLQGGSGRSPQSRWGSDVRFRPSFWLGASKWTDGRHDSGETGENTLEWAVDLAMGREVFFRLEDGSGEVTESGM